MSHEAQEEFARVMMDGRLSRREVVRRLAGLGLSLPVATALAARVAPDAAEASPGPVTGRHIALQATGNGTLIVGSETDIEGFDPGHASALATTRVNNNVLEGLVKYKPGTVELEPHLALEVPSLENGGISADGLTYTYKLRQGVKFHDGTDFNADAVKMTYQRLIDKSFKYYDKTNTSGFFVGDVKQVDVVDPYTVKVTLQAPNAAHLEFANVYAAKIMSPKAIQEVPAAQWAEGSYGTGPFKVKSWDKGTKVELERNEAYWGPKPALQTLIFRPIPEPTARVAALLNGEVDMIVVVPPDAIDSIKSNKDLTYQQGPSLHYWFIQLNTKDGPFKDKRVRQAANYAVNKEGLATDILHGSAVPATQPMPAANWSYNPDVKGYPYDPAKAKALLQQAGLGDGFKTKMIIPQSGSGMMIPVPMNEYIQGNLRDVGIDLEIQTFEWVSYLGVWAKGLSSDITMGNQSIMASEPYVANLLLSGAFTPSAGGWNIGYYDNPEVDKLLDQAKQTPDRAKRKQLYYQAWALITDDAPWIFVVNDLQPMAFKTKVKGYLTNPAYVIDFTTISIEGE